MIYNSYIDYNISSVHVPRMPRTVGRGISWRLTPWQITSGRITPLGEHGEMYTNWNLNFQANDRSHWDPLLTSVCQFCFLFFYFFFFSLCGILFQHNFWIVSIDYEIETFVCYSVTFPFKTSLSNLCRPFMHTIPRTDTTWRTLSPRQPNQWELPIPAVKSI